MVVSFWLTSFGPPCMCVCVFVMAALCVINDNNNNNMAKYADLPASYLFQPVALETLGPINDSSVDFLSELGSRIGTASGEIRERQFLS